MKKLVIFLLIFIFFLGINFSTGWGKEVSITWDAPTTNKDGSPLTDLAGYKVYYGNIPGSYAKSIDVGNSTTYVLTLPNDGKTYYINVTAYDTSGNESEFNGEINITVPDEMPPKPPTGCRFVN